MKTVLVSILVTVLPFAIAVAEPDRRGPPRPPPEAFTACANLAEGDACSVKLADHTIAGTCEKFPDQAELACRPDHPPGPPPGDGSGHH